MGLKSHVKDFDLSPRARSLIVSTDQRKAVKMGIIDLEWTQGWTQIGIYEWSADLSRRLHEKRGIDLLTMTWF